METLVYAGRVLRCRDGQADVALIQPKPKETEARNCDSCGGGVRCPVPHNATILHLPVPRPLAPGEDVEVEVGQAPPDYGGAWGAMLLVSLFFGVVGLGVAERLTGTLPPAALFTIGGATGGVAAVAFAGARRRRARLAAESTRIL